MNRICLAVALALGWAALASADDWGEVAQISTTLGVQANRLCLGEASRGDIGCPTYAPYVNSGGLVGIGTSTPSNTLTISRAIGVQNNIELRADQAAARSRLGGITLNRFVYDPSGEAAAIDFYRVGNTSEAEIVFRTNPGTSVGVSATERMRLNQYGSLGIGTSYPSTSLHVSGTLRMANGGEACDTNRAGAVRWHAGAGQFQVCYGSGGWALLSSAAVSGTLGTTPDRIVSGTSSVIASQDRSVTIATGGTTRMTVGENGYVGIGVTYPSTTLHVSGIIQSNGTFFTTASAFTFMPAGGGPWLPIRTKGINIGDWYSHPNYGDIFVGDYDFDVIRTNGTNMLKVTNSGNVGISTSVPSQTLTVVGNTWVSGTVKVAGTGAEDCTMGTLGQIRLNPTSGKFEVCRQ